MSMFLLTGFIANGKTGRRAGGVACYVKNDVLYTRIVELEDQ